jgi:catechol 2,3-dioxygenase-like lactoylglutathione lyase family enzyme
MFTQANVTLMVADLDRAVQFYTDGLGLKLGFRAGNDWAQVEAPGLTIGLHPAGDTPKTTNASSQMSIGFQVAKLETAVEELRRRGVTIDQPVREGGVDRIVSFADPDGIPLYLIQF